MTKSAFVAEFFAAIQAAGMNVTELDAHIANDLIDIKF